MKVAEPKILTRLQSELLKPQVMAYIGKAVEQEAQEALGAPQDGSGAIQRQLDQAIADLEGRLRNWKKNSARRPPSQLRRSSAAQAPALLQPHRGRVSTLRSSGRNRSSHGKQA